MSRRDLTPAYTCGTYRRHGRSGHTSYHIRMDWLDELLKIYVRRLKDGSSAVMDQLRANLARETDDVSETEQSVDHLLAVLDDLHEDLKATKRQRIQDIMKHPEQKSLLEGPYDEMENDLQHKIEGITHQIEFLSDKRNIIIHINRVAKTTHEVFEDIIPKKKNSTATIWN